ncbi:MAG: hypothetical protein ACLFR1_13685 [Spirochaetia bacterium]
MFYFLDGIVLIILGILGLSAMISEKMPQAEDVFKKVESFKGYIGIAALVYGLWSLITVLIRIGWISLFPVGWISGILGAIVTTGLGFLMGFSTVKNMIKEGDAQEKMVQVYDKITPYQKPLGIAAVVIGVWGLIYPFVPIL